jgi:hypothetical protein
MSNGHQPFSTIESTQEYLTLLSDKIDEVLEEARRELSACKFDQKRERVHAWQLVLYTITKLSSHIANSRRLMSDLNTLRELLDESHPHNELEAEPLAVDFSAIYFKTSSVDRAAVQV